MTNAELEQQIVNHLEFLGYEVNPMPADIVPEGAKGLRADRGRFEGINISVFERGVEFCMWYELGESAIANREGLLEVVNNLNRQRETKYSVMVAEESPVLWTNMLYSGLYDKKAFARFVTTWESESRTLLDTGVADFVE
jgi:hypothetical protein